MVNGLILDHSLFVGGWGTIQQLSTFIVINNGVLTTRLNEQRAVDLVEEVVFVDVFE